MGIKRDCLSGLLPPPLGQLQAWRGARLCQSCSRPRQQERAVCLRYRSRARRSSRASATGLALPQHRPSTSISRMHTDSRRSREPPRGCSRLGAGVGVEGDPMSPCPQAWPHSEDPAGLPAPCRTGGEAADRARFTPSGLPWRGDPWGVSHGSHGKWTPPSLPGASASVGRVPKSLPSALPRHPLWGKRVRGSDHRGAQCVRVLAKRVTLPGWGGGPCWRPWGCARVQTHPWQWWWPWWSPCRRCLGRRTGGRLGQGEPPGGACCLRLPSVLRTPHLTATPQSSRRWAESGTATPFHRWKVRAPPSSSPPRHPGVPPASRLQAQAARTRGAREARCSQSLWECGVR